MPWWVFYCVVKYSTDYVPLCICYIDLLKSTSMIYGNVMVKSTSPDHDAARCQSRFRLLVRCRVLQVTGIFKLDSESWCTNAHTFSPASLKGSTCMCGTKWLLLDSTTKLRHIPHVHLTTQWLVWHRQCLFAYFMAQVLHCSVLLPVITCYGAPLRSGFLDDVLLPTFCTQVNNTQKFHHYFIITHNQSGEWALEMSLTRPLFFLYFWEIRKLQGSTIALISAHTNIIHHLLYLATWNSAGH